MENTHELFTKKIHAGNRTYFIDVKQTKEGDKYISITENRRKNNEYLKSRLMIFQEDIKKFNDAFNDAVAFVNKMGEVSQKS